MTFDIISEYKMNAKCCNDSNPQTPMAVTRKIEPVSLLNPEVVKHEENVDVDSLDIVGAVQHGALDRVIALLDSGQLHNISKKINIKTKKLL